MAKCRNCGETLGFSGIYLIKLECPICAYTYEHKFKTKPTCDDLLEEYEKEPWNKRI